MGWSVPCCTSDNTAGYLTQIITNTYEFQICSFFYSSNVWHHIMIDFPNTPLVLRRSIHRYSWSDTDILLKSLCKENSRCKLTKLTVNLLEALHASASLESLWHASSLFTKPAGWDYWQCQLASFVRISSLFSVCMCDYEWMWERDDSKGAAWIWTVLLMCSCAWKRDKRERKREAVVEWPRAEV